MIKIKRVYEEYDVADGTRVLVDRLWPRGVRRASPKVDIWMRDVAPSSELRKWFSHDPGKWQEFKKRYLKELSENDALGKLIELVRTNSVLTLIYAARDEQHNDAMVLKSLLEKKLIVKRGMDSKAN